MRRVAIDVTDQEHKALTEMARATGTTIANVVRKALGFPPVRKGDRKDLRIKKEAGKR